MNKILTIALKISIIFLLGNGYAQTVLLPHATISEDVIISTPDVMSFQKYGNVPISLYNGKIDMTIPFYEIQAGKIKIPINLTYNSGGIKVDEIASGVGLGWNLNAGGNILVGINDFADGTLKYELRGYLPIDVGYVKKYFLKNPMFNSNVEWSTNVDSKPDFYYVNAPGLNNVFILDDANPDNYQIPETSRKYIPSFLYPKGYKIAQLDLENLGSFHGIGFTGEEDGNPDLNIPVKDFNVNIAGYFDYNFNITNENGLIYNFRSGNIVESRTLPVLVDTSAFSFDPSYSLDTNTYNLTSIYDPSTQQKVEFIYEKYQITAPQRIKFLSKKNNIGNSDPCNFGFIPEFEGQPIYSNEKLIKYTAATRLQKIIFSSGEVEFLYLNNRQDYDDKTLDLIRIKDTQGNIIKSYRLKYSYFDSKEGCSQKECKRLKLDQIDEEYTGETKLYYSFDYYYTNKLPKRFSYEQDYLGYYNNNGYQNTAYIGAKESGPQPKLYFYPNKGAFSILPFKKTNDSQGREITGDYSFMPNGNSLTGLLKKVTYETKGFTEFKYENHTFNFDGAEYIAGGARIQSQIINDGNGNSREIKYKYKEFDGKSSGYISALPIFSYPNAKITNPGSPPDQWTPFSFTTYDFDKSGLELSHSNFVGYSKVEEIETGNGKTESYFYSPKEYPDEKSQRVYQDDCGKYLVENSAFPGKLFEDLKVKRGTLKQRIIKDENAFIISDIENIYQYRTFATINLKSYSPYRLTDNKYIPRIMNFNSYVTETSELNQEWNVQIQVISNEYFPTANKRTEQFFKYADNYPFITEQRIVDDAGELKTNTYYPFDLQVSGQLYVSDLVAQNRLNEPIKQENFKNNLLVATNQINYKNFGINILPKSLSVTKSGGGIYENTVIDIRDNSGNIVQSHDQANVYSSFIWGYNKTLPIAKIENATNAQIEAIMGKSILSLSELNLTAINGLRTSLPNSLVTTYTHIPLVGVSTITDSKGYVSYYQYDQAGRLKAVKDAQGCILSENEYHYKN